MMMQKKNLLLRLVVLVTAMMCALGIQAQEAYACYTSPTLTFYYDNQRSSRPGTTYLLNSGNIPGWYVNSANITEVVFDASFANARPTSTYCWFFYMSNLETIDGISNLNTSEVTNMSGMFNYCSNLTDLDLSTFNTANVTNMSSMFAFCSSLTSLDLSSFNTAKVTNMKQMFNGCTGLTSLNLRSFNTSKVTNMGNMFYMCSDLTTIHVSSGWTTAAVTSSDKMFDGCTSLVGGQGTAYSDSNPKDKTYAHIDGGTSNPGYLTEWKEAYTCYRSSTLTFYCDNMRSSRPGTTYDLNTAGNYPGWYTDGNNANVTTVVFAPSFANARPTTTYCWFLNMRNLESVTGISNLNTSEVTNMYGMFGYCTSLKSVDLSHFNTSRVTDMSCMFSFCGSLTSLDLSNFNTSNVTQMAIMFALCESLTSLDLSSFNTANVTEMENMFQGDTNLRTIYAGSGWSTAAVTNSIYMFFNCTSLVGGRGTAYNASNPMDMTYAHIDGGTSNPGYFTAKNASLRGDVNGDSHVSIADVTALIDYLLSHDVSLIDFDAADCNQDNSVSISDVTALIDYLLSGHW